MRIITGLARGKRLITLEGDTTRPTSERVKEALFSAIQFEIEGRKVLDLFAGSGQLGLEALSRGAERVELIDGSKEAIAVINENVKNVGLPGARVRCCEAIRYLNGSSDKFDIVFLDPPYASGLISEVLDKVIDKLNDFGVIVCEHSSKDEIEVPEWLTKKTHKYGAVSLTFIRKEK